MVFNNFYFIRERNKGTGGFIKDGANIRQFQNFASGAYPIFGLVHKYCLAIIRNVDWLVGKILIPFQFFFMSNLSFSIDFWRSQANLPRAIDATYQSEVQQRCLVYKRNPGALIVVHEWGSNIDINKRNSGSPMVKTMAASAINHDELVFTFPVSAKPDK
jgi:hypothetical protein